MVRLGNIRFSIIIPTLNESETLPQTLGCLFPLPDGGCTEVIISDGGSEDSTLSIASEFPCHVVCGAAGRALQMNRGSRVARGRWLLFLHADSRLPVDWRKQVENTQSWGFFPLRLSGGQRAFRVIEKAINLRSKLTRVATGDQGLFFTRSFFDRLGGFPDIPLMEDIAISKNARVLADPTISRSTMGTSSRRWEKNGITRTLLLMWCLRLVYWLGIDPARLHRLYYPGIADHRKCR